jgi:hypothetical protein
MTEINDRDIIITTLRNRYGVMPMIYPLYAARTNKLVDSLPKYREFPHLVAWVDALESAVWREEFSMLEDVAGFDA